LYDVVAKEDLSALVEEIVRKMGMESCADTRNAALSGGQRRRLSIGIALLKQPTLLFLGK
jgi:ABC-type multidrug transport system ATPase subunit